MLLVTMLTGGLLAENCYVLKDEATGQCALVDPGFISRELDEAARGDVRWILLTHGHFDHTGGVEHYRAMTGADVVCLAEEAALLSDPEQNLSAWVTPRAPLALSAGRTVQDGEQLLLGETTFTVLATPGHTAGGCCYYTPGWLFSGDTLMAGTVGRTDFPTGDSAALMRSVARLATLPGDTRLCSGHGAQSVLECEKKTNPYMGSL